MQLFLVFYLFLSKITIGRNASTAMYKSVLFLLVKKFVVGFEVCSCLTFHSVIVDLKQNILLTGSKLTAALCAHKSMVKDWFSRLYSKDIRFKDYFILESGKSRKEKVS